MTKLIIKCKIDEKVWKNEIRPYFLAKRGVMDIDKSLNDFNLSDEQIIKIKEKIKQKRKQKRTKIPSSFGEIYASFFLEKKENIFLIGLRWPREMFEIQTGVDLVGIDTDDFNVVYTEVKATEKTQKFLINKQKEKLPEDLKDDRLDQYFKEYTREPATKLWIIDLVKKLIDKNVINADKNVVEKLISSKEKYLRYGTLVHPPTKFELDFSPEIAKINTFCKEKHEKEGNKCKKKCRLDCSDRNPIYFVDLEVKDIKDRVDDIIELELTVIANHGRIE